MTQRTLSLGRSFVDSRSLVFWAMVGLAVYGLLHMSIVANDAQLYPAAAMLSGILWAVYGLVLAVIIYKLELFERRSPVTMFGAFLWGAIVVSGIAVVASPAAHELVGKLMPASMEDWASAIAAPLVEEPLKMLGVVALAFIPGARINSAIDGLYFGLLVGLGFEVVESFLYGVSASAEEGGTLLIVVLTFLIRGVVGGLWNHPTYTAITGAGVGYFFARRASLAKRTAAMVGSLLAAMALHFFFDSPLLEASNPLVATVVKGIPILILGIIVYRIAQHRERDLYGAVAASEVPADLISEDELATLTTRSARRKARHAVRHSSGFAAGHAMRRLQRRQSDLITAFVDEGPDAESTAEAADDVRDAREDLSQVVASHA